MKDKDLNFNDMGISVILPVYNNGSTLRKTIHYIFNQEYQCYELIIINDCSTDNTKKILNEFYNNKNVRIFHLGSNSGAAYCMNLGTEKARYSKIAIIDGDAEAEKDWLLKAADNFKNYDIIFGPFCTRPTTFFERALASVTGFPKESYRYTESCVGRFSPVGTNFFYNKYIFYKLNGFNTNLRVGYDRAFVYRAIENGGKIKYVPDSMVYHPMPKSIGKFLKRVYTFTCWDMIARKGFKLKKLRDYGIISNLKKMNIIILILVFFFVFYGFKVGFLYSVSFLIFVFLLLVLKYLKLSKDLPSAFLLSILSLLSSVIKLFVFIFRPNPSTHWR